MGLLDNIFPKRQNTDKLNAYFKTFTSYQPVFSNYSGGLYEAQATRAAIHAFATHCSKLKPEVLGAANPVLARTFPVMANPYQTTQQFLYRVATILAVNNNVFIAPMWDDNHDYVNGLYPLLPENCTVVEFQGKPWLKYRFATGQEAAMPLDEAAVLTWHQYKDDFFGTDNTALNPTLQMIHAQDQGIVEGIKNGSAVRFMAKLGTVLKQSAIDAERQSFAEANLSQSAGGVMMFDAKYADVKQIDSKPFIVDDKQMRIINDSVYAYMGVPEAIIKNDFSEQTYNAFYEGKIEPFALMLGQSLSSCIFNAHERAFGNEVMFSSNRLQYASIASKLQVSQQLLDRGVLSRNEVRDIWQLPHIDGGDDYVIRGEYMNAGNVERGDDNNEQ